MKFICIVQRFIFRTSKCHDKIFRYYSNKKVNENNPKQLLKHLDTMPKPTTHAVTLKKHRLKLKEKGQKYVPGTVNLQVLGSGAEGSPRSLYMFTDQSRYLFNCGEGTQRLAHEHKMKLSKLEHIFVTHPTWDNIGGLPGVSLTIQDVGVPQITIHGPLGTDEIFTATRRFVVLRYLAVKMATCEKDAVFEDNVMKVWYVPLCSPAAQRWYATPRADRSPPRSPERVLNTDDSTDDDVDYYAYWNNGSRSGSPTRAASPNRNKKRRHLSPDGRSGGCADVPPAGSVSMAYVCRLHDRPGSLSLPECVAHGVPPGPLLGQLKAGLDVTLPNGRVVLSRDVTSPDEPGAVFIVVECPGEEFLDSLESEEAFKRHQMGCQSDTDVAFLVVHFSPPHVMDHPRYRRWMGLFAPSTHHLVLNTSNRCMGSVAVHRIQHKLHLLCPQLFPLLADQGIPSTDTSGPQHSQDQVEVAEDNGVESLAKWFAVVPGHTFTNIHLRPQKLVDSSRKLVLEPEVWRQETLTGEGFAAALAELTGRLAGTGGGGYPRVVFLGTGSCIPNKTRNTSGILLQFSESSCMVLDCGEATYGQLVRLYGAARTADLLRGLRAVYVSHLHADHHIGLMGLLLARRAVTDQPLALLAPRQIRHWLNTYHSRFQPVLGHVTLVPNQLLCDKSESGSHSELAGLLEDTGLEGVRTCVVRHCPNAFAICLAHSDGWRITYSGDTMPCDDLVLLGKDCDLLIHEATMEDKLEGEARLKMHSTTSQAVEVGRQMGARFTLLTHFSQRYAKVPIFNQSFTDRVGIAFDNMEVALADLPKLSLLYPALRLMFAEHYEEMELKALKRQLQQERETARLAT